MADAMQGIMALSEAPEMGAQGAPQLNVDPAAMAAFEEARSQINPEEFGTELLKAGEQVDSAELKSLRQSLKAANLPPQIVDAIGQMVDAILAEPEKYAELRARFLAEGVPEDLLPAEFDAGFFAALNLALDQINTSFGPDTEMTGGLGSLPMGAAMPEAAPQAFARGGIAQLKPLAAEMAKMGRNGDTMLAHITPSEARMLRRNGGSGTINPMTGLPEFFFEKIVKSVGNVFKSVGKAVVKGVKAVVGGIKKFVSSSVGRVVTAVALGFFLGPAAATALFGAGASMATVAAVSGFVGGFGSSMLAGKGLGQSLKMGAIGGVAAGIGAGVMGGAEAFTAGSYAGPTTIGGQFDSLVSGTKNFFGAGTATGTPGSTFDPTVLPTEVGTPLPPAQTFPVSSGGDTISFNPPDLGPQTFSSPPSDIPNFTRPVNVSSTGYGVGMNDPGALGGGGAGDLTLPSVTAAPAPTVAAPTVSPDYVPPANYAGKTAGAFTGEYGDAPNLLQQAQQGLLDTQQGATGLFDRAKNFFLPETPSDTALDEIGLKAFRAAKAAGRPDFLAERAYKLAVEKATPSVLRKYGPLAAAGLGIMALSGGFKTPESQRPGLIPTQTGFDLAKMYPERYAVNVPDAVTTYSTTDPYANMYGTPIVRRSAPAAYNPQGANIRRFSDGGSTDYPTDMDEYIPMDGPIDGPGTGTSDSIPAMLSDGEFVFTAKAVRNMGNGSRREGAKRMYALMKQLEEAKNGN